MAKERLGNPERERELRESYAGRISAADAHQPPFLEHSRTRIGPGFPAAYSARILRSIARYLGLNEERPVGDMTWPAFKGAVPPQNKPEERIPRPQNGSPPLHCVVVLLVLAGLVAAAIYGWRKIQSAWPANNPRLLSSGIACWHSKTTETLTASDATSRRASAILLELSVSTSAATRCVSAVDGKVVLDRELPTGENRRFTATTISSVRRGLFRSVAGIEREHHGAASAHPVPPVE